ncbi:VOC family protein [Streptomyces iconiensis]|uniref:VOC family protein n=1 Tax=Streptomyces iconiensis TaxID=1384038 RepID=A0ABT6ZY61_9ACTN|nr:VOC family protein [Streptomyces iconiensis]MDJ1134003.1 VOC family protein [Streptomyces iconiensis]
MRSRAVRIWAASTAGAAALTVGLVAGAPTGAGAAPHTARAAATAEVVRHGQPSLYAKNVDTMLGFYRDAFGFQVDFRYPGTGHAVFGTVSLGDSYFLTFATYEVIKDSTPLKHIGPGKRKQSEIVVITTDVDALYKKALRAGAKGLMAPRDQQWGERSAYVSDPEGNLVQLSTHNGS